jgi:hypothetical protein
MLYGAVFYIFNGRPEKQENGICSHFTAEGVCAPAIESYAVYFHNIPLPVA